jgi:hypothetical protein
VARLTFASCVPVVLAALSLAPAASSRAPSACWSGYSYSGAESTSHGFGVSADVTLLRDSMVSSGHVAAWVGVGGVGLGPGGTDEWLQAGITRSAGGTDELYYEYKRPGEALATSAILDRVAPGETHTFVVYERAAQRDSWRVMIDGVKVSDPVTLPGSHGRFQPVATAENWDGGVDGSCNQYAFAFSSLAVRTQYAGAWEAFALARVLHDPAYRLTLGASGFLASSR